MPRNGAKMLKIYIIFLLLILIYLCSFNILNLINNLSQEIIPSKRTLGFDHIYVIGLDYRKDRREIMDKQISYLNLDVEYFKAVSKYDKILHKFTNINSKVTVGQRACYVSHYLIYQTIIEEGFNSALILEDDVDFEANITDIMADIYQNLPESWDTLHVGHCYETIGQPVGSSSFPNKLYQSVEPQCSHAYAVSNSGVHKLLKLIDPMNALGPIDYEISTRVKSKEIISYSIHPQPIIQWKEGNPSDVAPTSHYPFSLTNSTMNLLGLINENKYPEEWM
ncbi:glycosyltransferase family 25 protein [Gigaspora rosea]|uniref:Glycosyltransferase family 25 protein n=1 Tax=Gigaspora rosea TaxID=44941 RepID=A0A397UIR9_9GLOM|nr:glycosyltransferase family 25 protein [Gigaspora rosea]